MLEGNGSRPSHLGDGYIVSDVSYTLNHVERHGVCYNSWDIQSKHIQSADGVAETLYAGASRYGGGEAYVLAFGIDQQGGKGNACYTEDVAPTMASDSHGTPHAVCYAADIRNGALNEEINGTLQAKSNGGWNSNSNQIICYGIGSYGSNAWKSSNPHSGVYEAETARTLDNLQCGNPSCHQGGMCVVQSR